MMTRNDASHLDRLSQWTLRNILTYMAIGAIAGILGAAAGGLVATRLHASSPQQTLIIAIAVGGIVGVVDAARRRLLRSRAKPSRLGD